MSPPTTAARYSARPTRADPFAPRTRAAGFTLLELLAVVALMSALAFVLVDALAGGGRAVGLQAGQALVANLVGAARTRAMATGHRTRVLVHADPGDPARFRRALVLQEETEPGSWEDRGSGRLPDGVAILPYRARVPDGLYAVPADWTNPDGTPLGSSVLAAAPLMVAADGVALAAWDFLSFVPAGTTSGSGLFVLSLVQPRPAGSVGAGESPVQAASPESVRGVAVSVYGLPRLIDDRAGF